MKKVIRLTERDLTRIVKRTIREMDNDFDHNFDQEEYDNLLDQAREFLIDNSDDIGFEAMDIYDLSDDEIIDMIKDYDEYLYSKLSRHQNTKTADLDEPYDSIGGRSVNDLRRAFKKIKKR